MIKRIRYLIGRELRYNAVMRLIVSKNQIPGLCLSILLVIYMLLVSVMVVRADMGPKPSITLTVENAPSDYYVALLTNKYSKDEQQSNLYLAEVNEESVNAYLESFSYDGWSWFQQPLHHDVRSKNEKGIYRFDYMVPNPFRVILISGDGRVLLSETLSQKEYNADCVYDAAEGTLKETGVGTKTLTRIISIVLCFVLTLVIELFVLWLFGYPFNKRNIIHFLIINTITQLSLNTFLIATVDGILLFVFGGVYIEGFIMLTEGIYYAVTLRDKEGNRRGAKAFLYSIVANLSSIVIGSIVYLSVSDLYMKMYIAGMGR